MIRRQAFKRFKTIASTWLREQFTSHRRTNKRPNWIQADWWAELQEYWKSQEFLKLSDQNKSNSTTNKAIHWHGGHKGANKYWEEMVRIKLNLFVLHISLI